MGRDSRPVLYVRDLTVESLQIVALSDGVGMRVLGISIASFSAGSFNARALQIVAEDSHGLGLGGLTFLQLSTTYVPTIAGRSVGYAFLEKTHYHP